VCSSDLVRLRLRHLTYRSIVTYCCDGSTVRFANLSKRLDLWYLVVNIQTIGLRRRPG